MEAGFSWVSKIGLESRSSKRFYPERHRSASRRSPPSSCTSTWPRMQGGHVGWNGTRCGEAWLRTQPRMGRPGRHRTAPMALLGVRASAGEGDPLASCCEDCAHCGHDWPCCSRSHRCVLEQQSGWRHTHFSGRPVQRVEAADDDGGERGWGLCICWLRRAASL